VNILSINFGHDASMAFFQEGTLIHFEEHERTSRIKHHLGLSAPDVINFLERAGTTLNKVSVVSICSTQGWAIKHCKEIEVKWGVNELASEKSDTDFDTADTALMNLERNDLYKTDLECSSPSPVKTKFKFPLQKGIVTDAGAIRDMLELAKVTPHKSYLKELITPGLIRIRDNVFAAYYVNHHYCHAQYTHFYARKPSLCLTHDGGGNPFSLHGSGIFMNDIDGIKPIADPLLTLGPEYDYCASLLGIDCGKLMGLAAYARPQPFVQRLVSDFCKNISDGLVSDRSNIEIETRSRNLEVDEISLQEFDFKFSDAKFAAQLAANVQYLVESVLTTTFGRFAEAVSLIQKERNQSFITGGFALNCPTNTLLNSFYSRCRFTPLPACGDTGLSIGAAVAVSKALGADVNLASESNDNHYIHAAFPPFNHQKKQVISFDDQEVDEVRISVTSIPAFLSVALSEGNVICIFQGRSEVGPRALGHRSIIGSACSTKIRDRINISKGRELWRPLAPMVRDVDYSKFFSGDSHNCDLMLTVSKVMSPTTIPGVTHVDSTARVQVLTSSSELLYNTLTFLASIDQVPVIINTSFNCSGEPIVETPSQAFRSFIAMQFDYLYIDGHIFKPKTLKF
jgi:carbamoyltransferase